jgi:hypothetical protein
MNAVQPTNLWIGMILDIDYDEIDLLTVHRGKSYNSIPGTVDALMMHLEN